MFKFLKKIDKNEKDLIKSSNKLVGGLASIFNGRKLDDTMLEELEYLLISSDMGTNIPCRIISFLSSHKFDKNISLDDIKNIIYSNLMNVFENYTSPMDIDIDSTPCIIMFLGVNGSGKTTIVGKLANKLHKNEKKILLAACDTFRAGAIQQLDAWKDKTNVDIILPNKEKEDPSSVIYRVLEESNKHNYDAILIDTAGRLQNNVNLMFELQKMNKTIDKFNNGKKHINMLVMDATIGQNSVKQYEEFSKFVNIDGIIMNKMDGTSKGGILVPLVEKFKKPIFAIGTGEKIDDIKSFDAKEFIKNILNIE